MILRSMREMILGKTAFIACIAVFVTITNVSAQRGKYFADFPRSCSPKEVGKKVALRYLSFPFRDFGDINAKPANYIVYPEVCAWLGALRFAKSCNDKDLSLQLERRYYPLFGEKRQLLPKPDHVDHSVFGSVPLEIYQQTKNESFLYAGIYYADAQWQLSEGSGKNTETYQSLLNQGLAWQTRFWIDDMFMITAVQTQAYKATGDRKYIDRAALEMSRYLDSIQRPNGLFYHAGTAPFFWSRGNGWMAAGMTELLKVLPSDNPNREKILTQYRKMMATLKEYQRPDGMWGQLVDDSTSWAESSGTGMFTYAIITGVKKGWLHAAEYAPVAKKAWMKLVTFIDKNGDVTSVCEGTNIGNTKEYYLGRKPLTGDMHGQALVLWCATALLE